MVRLGVYALVLLSLAAAGAHASVHCGSLKFCINPKPTPEQKQAAINFGSSAHSCCSTCPTVPVNSKPVCENGVEPWYDDSNCEWRWTCPTVPAKMEYIAYPNVFGIETVSPYGTNWAPLKGSGMRPLSFSSCKAECDKYYDCVAFVYNAATSRCWIGDKVTDAINNANPDPRELTTTYVAKPIELSGYQTFAGIFAIEKWYPSSWPWNTLAANRAGASMTIDQCREECDKHHQCIAFSWYGKMSGTTPANNCWLGNEIGSWVNGDMSAKAGTHGITTFTKSVLPVYKQKSCKTSKKISTTRDAAVCKSTAASRSECNGYFMFAPAQSAWGCYCCTDSTPAFETHTWWNIYTSHTTKRPTNAPTRTPTKHPTKVPTKDPTKVPTKDPTKAPTKDPTKAPTKPCIGTLNTICHDVVKTVMKESCTSLPFVGTSCIPIPTFKTVKECNTFCTPTSAPTRKPTPKPTKTPTKVPTKDPTVKVTPQPTSDPTVKVTSQPTSDPTVKVTTSTIVTESPTVTSNGLQANIGGEQGEEYEKDTNIVMVASIGGGCAFVALIAAAALLVKRNGSTKHTIDLHLSTTFKGPADRLPQPAQDVENAKPKGILFENPLFQTTRTEVLDRTTNGDSVVLEKIKPRKTDRKKKEFTERMVNEEDAPIEDWDKVPFNCRV